MRLSERVHVQTTSLKLGARIRLLAALHSSSTNTVRISCYSSVRNDRPREQTCVLDHFVLLTTYLQAISSLNNYIVMTIVIKYQDRLQAVVILKPHGIDHIRLLW